MRFRRGVPEAYAQKLFAREMPVNQFTFDAPMYLKLQASLSPERLATYLAAAGGDQEKAIRLHAWNTSICSAFYGPLQGLEVTLRNALHRQLTRKFGAAWYDSPHCRLDARAQDVVAETKRRLRRLNPAPADIVADLSFGFWVALLSGGGTISHQIGAASAHYDTHLWTPALHKAFPNGPKLRKPVFGKIKPLSDFRNRIAHHEPVFNQLLLDHHTAILDVLGWICPGTRDWVAHHSRVPDILSQPRDAGDIRF